MTQREIDDERREILESDEFGSDLIDFISDGVTPEQASKLGKLVDDGHTDKAGQYIFHLLYSEIDKIIRRIQEAK